MESAAAAPRLNRPILVFGLSGALGRALLDAAGDGHRFVALSRQAQPTDPRVAWRTGSLEQPPALPDLDFDCVLSLGPLDAFAAWLQRSAVRMRRVIAVGSTSVHSRRDSADAGERALAARLREAEQGLAQACRARGACLQLLRPTLVYGPGTQGLAGMVRVARRLRVLPLPRRAVGLRQPVHAGDVAAVLVDLVGREAPDDFELDLPGGEAIAFDAMLVRCLSVAAPGSRLWRIPDACFDPVAGLAGRAGLLAPGLAGTLSRLSRDQVFDAAPAKARLGWQPRAFRPLAGDLC